MTATLDANDDAASVRITCRSKCYIFSQHESRGALDLRQRRQPLLRPRIQEKVQKVGECQRLDDGGAALVQALQAPAVQRRSVSNAPQQRPELAEARGEVEEVVGGVACLCQCAQLL